MGWFFRKKSKPLSFSGVVFLGEDLDAGLVVDRETAMEISAVFACINALATDIGQIPLKVYRYTASGREELGWSREGKAFRYGPNAYQTMQDWLEQAMIHLLTYGDTYSRIGRVNGYFDQLYPIEDPATIATDIRGGRKVHTNKAGDTWQQSEMFHMHGPSADGYTGRDFTDLHRQTLSLAKALYRYGARFFANGGQARGILILPASASADSIEKAKTAYKANYGGGNVHDVAVFANGTDFKVIDVDPEKSQALESRKQVCREIASLYKVPTWRLYGDQPPTLDARTAYYTDTLGPWLVRIAGNVNKQLMPDDQTYAEFVTAALLRADIKVRYDAYAVGITSRFLSPNEVRSRENMDGYDGGDEYVNPNVMSAEDRKAIEAQKGTDDAAN